METLVKRLTTSKLAGLGLYVFLYIFKTVKISLYKKIIKDLECLRDILRMCR